MTCNGFLHRFILHIVSQLKIELKREVRCLIEVNMYDQPMAEEVSIGFNRWVINGLHFFIAQLWLPDVDIA